MVEETGKRESGYLRVRKKKEREECVNTIKGRGGVLIWHGVRCK
jgi:hypothetical protein